MDSDEEDYVFIGTSLDGVSAETCTSRKAANPENVPVWRQTVTDERGRARLHGVMYSDNSVEGHMLGSYCINSCIFIHEFQEFAIQLETNRK